MLAQSPPFPLAAAPAAAFAAFCAALSSVTLQISISTGERMVFWKWVEGKGALLCAVKRLRTKQSCDRLLPSSSRPLPRAIPEDETVHVNNKRFLENVLCTAAAYILP